MLPIIDLHCDLLAYLQEKPDHTAEDPESKCSLPQLQKGRVSLQVLAFFTETAKGSREIFLRQLRKYHQLLEKPTVKQADSREKSSLKVIPAVENASGLLEEDEPFEHIFDHFDTFQQAVKNILYISLTWNGENRFGGGNESGIGLKKDGQMLLDFLGSKNIAIDLSHTSDALAHDILQYIDRHNLSIVPIASHSNYRHICDAPRNLPDEIAKEIFQRKGVVGINLIRRFLGDSSFHIIDHIEYGIALGGEDSICLGTDFFGGIHLPPALAALQPFFFEEFADASCYPKLLEFFEKQLGRPIVEKIAYKNALNFLKNQKIPVGSLSCI
ncbi:MAG: dipeptidase [Simkaniaceae bacterium]